jgi:hypothetical protein
MLCIRCISAYDMCSAAHWVLYSAVRCNFDYQVHVIGDAPYVGWATCSRATMKIRLYVLKKKEKKGSSQCMTKRTYYIGVEEPWQSHTDAVASPYCIAQVTAR